MHTSSVSLALLLALTSCSPQKKEATSTSQASPQPVTSTTVTAQPQVCKAAPDYRPESIVLPPAFARDLPHGMEQLWFSPDMFTADGQGYFSYVFSLRFDKAKLYDEASMEAMFEHYFGGLMKTVAEGKKRAADPSNTTVDLSPAEGGFVGVVHTVDEFVTQKPVTLNLQVQSTDTCIVVSASPKDQGHQIWKELAAARTCLPCASK